MVTRLLLCAAVGAILQYAKADSKTSSAVDAGTEKTKKLHHTGYVPAEYSDYIPEMDGSGIKYEKYMQGQPAAMKFQEKVLPEGSYQKYIPLSQNGKASVQENFAPEALLAAVKSEKRADSKGNAKDKDESTAENSGNSEMDFQHYLHQPSPGPVVDRKYGKYVPSKYSDYIPEMDDSGIKYEKYMQGQQAAMKFQEKVLPEGSYQKYIPLSQNGKASVQELAAAKSEKRDDSKGSAKDKDESTAENAGNSEMDFQRYLHQPSPGPVVDRKYGKYVPSKYGDYIPEMDDSGIKYEKYMPDKGTEMHKAGSSSRGSVVAEEVLVESGRTSQFVFAMVAMISGAMLLAAAFRRSPSVPLGLQQPLTASADQQV